ncbi:MAG: AP-2 complex subunit sigma [Cercozoa sp. M6MM]
MIKFFLVQNRQGRTRLSKYYVNYSGEEKRKVEEQILRLVTKRDSRHTNFVDYEGYRVIYRRYCGLFFSFCADTADNELALLEAIHLFVELLDRYFGSVRELDLIHHFHVVYQILDEYLLNGELEETNKTTILNRMRELEQLE